uniref:Aftiphilin clathrin-binding box domain-containing protein n=1 Tax=Onchocerca volvulus TaxID=6282 RepID=A0A8R1TXL5_ONCVO
MFEDDPPPLPAIPSLENSCDGTFADLDDHNRYTAVADDDYNRNDVEFRSHMSAVFRTELDAEFISPEMTTPRTEFTKLDQTPDRAQNVVTKTVLHSDSSEQHKLSFSSLQSQSPQFAQSSKSRSPSSETLCFPEDSDVVSNTITAHPVHVDASIINTSTALSNVSAKNFPLVFTESVHEDEIISDGSHDIQTFGTGGKDPISTEITKNGIKDNSDLQNFDLIDGSEKTVIVPSALQNESLEEGDDEFGDFEKFTRMEETQKNENDSWADFEASSLPDSYIKNKSTENITSSGTELQFVVESSLLPTLVENLCDDQLWATVGGEGENNDEYDISDSEVYEALSDTINMKGNKGPDKMVWMSVSIIEEALALKLQWHDSLIRSCFLHSLDVDVNQAVIRNSGLPAFAQQLEESAILAPVSVMESCTEATLMGEKNSLPQSNSTEFISHAGIEKSSVSHQAPSRSVTIDSLAVPPVQFDWNNSGLTNPLKTGSLSVSSASLDLDFLVSTGNKGSADDGSSTIQVFSTLQKDLTAFGLSLPDDVQNSKTEKDVTSKTPMVLEYLLNKDGDKRKYKPVSELSLDARALHDQLPDLDYMLSNVLLFPIVDR